MGYLQADIAKDSRYKPNQAYTPSPLPQHKVSHNPFQAAFQNIQTKTHSFPRLSSLAERELEAKQGQKPLTLSGQGKGMGGNSLIIQRDLATPQPENTPEEQPELSPPQIQDALRFNRMRYDADNTRIIQDIVGTEPTGTWTEDDILAISHIQETYGLQKDGKVGPGTFAFIQHEQELEGVPSSNEECLTMFRVVRHPTQVASTAGPGGVTRIRGHHYVEARFSPRCNCGEFEYRQFIAGVAMGWRGPNSQDLSGLFNLLPGGQLPITMQEDGNTTCPGIFYGHRSQAGQNSTTSQCGENQYRDDQGNPDQAQGCFYRGEDFPQIRVNGLQTGDLVDLQVQFRGEIRRNGAVVQTKNWTTVDEQVTTP